MDAFKKIGQSIKKIGKGVANEIKGWWDTRNTKLKILHRFEMKHLKRICRDYGIGQPSQYEEDFLTGERHKITLTREDYISYIVGRLSLEQIINYANKHKIDIYDILKERRLKEQRPVEKTPEISQTKEKQITKIEIKRQSEFETILESIEEDFTEAIYDLRITDEKAITQQLAVFLRMHLKDNKIEVEKPTPRGRIDILIDDKYALEVKYADNKGTLEKGVAEVKRYSKMGYHVAVIIYDVNKLSPNTINDYKEFYKEEGAEVIIIRGRGARKKKRKKTEVRIGNKRITID